MAAGMESVRDEAERNTEELAMLRARQESLLALIAELLETNEKLRIRVGQLEKQTESGREPTD